MNDPTTAFFEEAVAAYRAALEEYTRDRVPLDWARTQMNLGVALLSLGESEPGTARLEEAAASYRAALEEVTRDRAPWYWANAQLNLGNIYLALGIREAGLSRLEEAITAYRAALEEWTRDRVPLQWAKTIDLQGSAMLVQAERTGDPTLAAESLQRLLEAEAEFRAGGHAPGAEKFRRLIPVAEALVARLSGNPDGSP